jgi:hypothetical protein
LDYTLELEKKIASLPKSAKQIVRMVFCGDKIRWREDQLEDFADFYFRGVFRQDDPFRELQAHHLKQKGIQIERSIGGFCYMQRPVLELGPRKFTLDVHGPTVGR